ncbi:MAG: hypothetical protein J0L85_20400 [Zoogloea sp.]|nr:hypothetical protein [Zoogloea sp.]MCA0188527.1 hypothetical protein [Pseudomonadota bacterium]
MHKLELDRKTYLDDSNARSFIDWLVDATYNGNFSHQYTTAKNVSLVFKDVNDAYLKYHWSFSQIAGTPGCPAGSSFLDNSIALSVLQHRLQGASTDAMMVGACIAVFEWGKVTNGNVSWVNSNEVGLHKNITSWANELGHVLGGGPALLPDGELRFNAGFSKVYSLLVNGLVIYDSRVAATLGLAVQRWNESRGQAPSGIPDVLRFPWASAKGGQNRNPGSPMPRLRSGLMHAWAAIYASMILGEVSLRTGLTPRQLEAAWFMLGYEIPKLSSASQVPLPVPQDDSPSPPSEHTECQEICGSDMDEHSSDEDGEVVACSGSWMKSYTPTRKIAFFWRFSREKCRIEWCSPKGPRLLITADELVCMLNVLHRQFGSNVFPLSNSATGMRAPNPPWGVGRAFYEVTHRNPPDSSKVAAICEDLDLFVRILSTRKIEWALSQNALNIIRRAPLGDMCADIAALVEDSYFGE